MCEMEKIKEKDKVQIIEQASTMSVSEFYGKVGKVTKICKTYCWVSFLIGKSKWPKEYSGGTRYVFYPVDDPIKLKFTYNEIKKIEEV